MQQDISEEDNAIKEWSSRNLRTNTKPFLFFLILGHEQLLVIISRDHFPPHVGRCPLLS